MLIRRPTGIILSADKDPVARKLLSSQLKVCGEIIEHHTFAAGEELINSYIEQGKVGVKPIIICTSYKLAGHMTGVDLVSTLRESGYDRLIIAISGGGKNIWAEFLEHDGDFQFCEKTASDRAKRFSKIVSGVIGFSPE
jgi:CheY-like chemotaxis protein